MVERVPDTDSQYTIHVIIYSDRTSNVLPGEGTLYLGDGNVITDLVNNSNAVIENLDNKIAKNIYTVTHDYSSENDLYTIGYSEFNRNPGIINMSNSATTPFYIETTFAMSTPCGINNTPVLSIPPIDYATAGKIFIHNPGAWDREGDSLSFELVVPEQARGIDVNDYFFPEAIQLDSLSGEIKWHVPFITGQYNVAFKVNEWRKVADSVVYLSTTERDMQVIVVDNQGRAPEISIPADTCLQAGDYISESITVADPDNDQIKLEPFGKVFLFPLSPAEILPDSIFFDDNPVAREFLWQTNLTHISSTPYQVHFKATDSSGGNFPQVDFKTWIIKVSAPSPENGNAGLLDDGRILLNWDPYTWGADRIRISRRIVSYDIPASACFTGIPEYARYDSIAKVPGNITEYFDQHADGRFPRGANVCYRLVAMIPGCTETESAASNDICIQIPVDAPVITNVSTQQTDIQNGKIYIRWTSSFDLDTTAYNPSLFSYRLKRAEGMAGNANPVIVTPGNFRDTVFVDSGINTEELAYNYTVYLYEGNNLIDSSATASTVRVVSEPVVGEIGLQWQAKVPWSNNTRKYPWHYIYRDHVDQNAPDDLFLIDSVNVNYDAYHYIDDTEIVQDNQSEEFCYYIKTAGSYGNPDILEPLLNNSQELCIHPYDTLPPCPPDVVIRNNTDADCNAIVRAEPCDFNNYVNDLIISPGCDDDDISGFNIYFSDSYNGPFEFLAFTENEQFRHDLSGSFKGCYKIKAVDYSGNESMASEMICRDNCPYFELPNIFTPNDDGFNDQFTEFTLNPGHCPRFVDNINFSVYNRYGKLVYSSDPEPDQNYMIRWDGKDNKKMKVPAGVYYYEVNVSFDVLNSQNRTRLYKGWIEVMY